MIPLRWRPNQRESALFGLLGLLALVVGVERAVATHYIPQRQHLSREIEKHEALLLRNRVLRAQEESIRARHAALEGKAGRETEGVPPSVADALRDLQRLAETEVRFLSVVPEGTTDAAGSATFAIEFIDERGRLGRFLERILTEMDGEVLALQASAGERDVKSVQCQATVKVRVADRAAEEEG